MEAVITFFKPFLAFGGELIWLAFWVIIISLGYLLLIDGLMDNVTFSRLTKASFKLNFFSIINLWAAYFVSAIIFIYIYSEADTFLKITPLHELTSDGFDMVLTSLVAVYIGRIITKNNGVFYGKVYYSTLLAFASLIFIFNSFIFIGAHNLSSQILTESIFSFIHKNSFAIVWAIPGTLILATLGEFVLSLMKPTKRNLMCVSEKLPSDFIISTGIHQAGLAALKQEVIGDHHGTIDKLKEMLVSRDINQIKCFTRSLWIVEQIEKIIDPEEKGILGKENFKIVKLPDEIAREKFAKDACKRHPSIDYFFKTRELEFDEDIANYLRRSKSLYKYDVKEADIGDLRFAIVEYSNKTRKIMLFTKDTGPIGNTVGAYSEEAYVVQMFTNIFDLVWRIAEHPHEIKLDLGKQFPWWWNLAPETLQDQITMGGIG